MTSTVLSMNMQLSPGSEGMVSGRIRVGPISIDRRQRLQRARAREQRNKRKYKKQKDENRLAHIAVVFTAFVDVVEVFVVVIAVVEVQLPVNRSFSRISSKNRNGQG